MTDDAPVADEHGATRETNEGGEENEESEAEERERETDSQDGARHLADVPDGCGCAEIWERLSEQRDD